jgi:hypothetical protein
MTETHRAELSDAAFPATLTIVAGTTGLAPTLAVRDPGTPNSYLDFADDTFKTAGWTTQFQVVAQVDAVESPGVYERSLNIAAWAGLTAGSNHVKLEWSVLINGNTRRPSDSLELVNHAYDVAVSTDILSDATPFAGADVAAILADTAAGGAGPWSSATGFETEASAAARAVTNQTEHDATQALVTALPVPLTSGQVNAEVDTALADYDGPTRAELASDVAPLALEASVQSVITTGGAGPWTSATGFETEASAATRAAADLAAHTATQSLVSAGSSPAAVLAGITYDANAQTINAEVYLARNGDRVTSPTSATITVFAAGGTVAVITGASAAPNARGVFTFSLTPIVLAPNTVYTVDVGVDDGTPETDTYALPVHA